MAITRKYPDIYEKPVGVDARSVLLANILRKRMYLALRYELSSQFRIGDDTPAAGGGAPPRPRVTTLPENFPGNADTADEVLFASVYGQLLKAGYGDPSLGRLDRGGTPSKNDTFFSGGEDPAKQGTIQEFGDETDPADDPNNPQMPKIPFRVLIVAEFKDRVGEAVRRFNLNVGLYTQTWIQLRDQGVGKVNGNPTETEIFAKQLAEVAERLIVANVDPDDPYIKMRVLAAINQSLGGEFDAMSSAVDIDPPDLEAGTTVEIIADNLKAVRLIYFSAHLEEMKTHAAVEKIVEHFQSGMLPVSRGSAADRIYAWIKGNHERLNEVERRGIYGRVLGLAQGATNEGAPNREFPDLWYRFLATVSLKYREIYSSEKDEVSVEQIHKAARDLAVNISLHGYGIAYPAAVEMQNIVNDMFAITDEQAILRAYGVNDRWQLVDRISALYLGGVVNGVKYRTMAGAGEKIIKWLADRAPRLASSSASSLDLVRSGLPTPSLQEIADLAERWLAVTGTPDESVRRNSDPVDLQSQYTVPMLGQSAGMSPFVQDALNQAGVGGMIPNLPVIPQA